MDLRTHTALLVLSLAAARCGTPTVDVGHDARADASSDHAVADAGGPVDASDPATHATSLTVTPANSTLDVPDGQHPTLAFHVDAHYADGHTATDVPAVFSLDLVGVGAFAAQTFTASGSSGGVATVTAAYGGAMATTSLTVRLHVARHDMGTSDATAAAAAMSLPTATDTPSLAPTIAYPYDNTVMPPNLYRVEWQWQPVAGADLYLATLSSPTSVVDYVTTSTSFTLAAADWRALIDSNRGRTVALTIRAARAADLTHAGSSTVHVTFGPQDLAGGLYYFTTDDAQTQQGIYRYDFGVPEPTSTRFMADMGAGTCVGCHALSRSGDRMAVTFEGGYGYLGSFQTDAPGAWSFGGPAGPQRGAFAEFFDADSSIVAVYDAQAGPEGGDGDPTDVHNGQIRVYDATTGAVDDARQVPIGTGHRAAHVAVAPDGLTVVYVDFADTADRPIHETQGTLRTVRYDHASRTWSTPTTLVAYDGTLNNYYPSVSPDGAWVLFNRAPGDAYDNPDATLWVVPLDGSRPPVQLATAGMLPHVHNSWPRWAPFVQMNELGAARLWITFSSFRDYGIRLVGMNRPQIWMAAFDPTRTIAMHDGSSPAFWLPFQDLATRNHTAVWTERVAPRNCATDADCLDPTLRCDATSRTCVQVNPPG